MEILVFYIRRYFITPHHIICLLFPGGLVLTAGASTATIPTAALLAGKAIVIKGLLLNQLLAEQA